MITQTQYLTVQKSCEKMTKFEKNVILSKLSLAPSKIPYAHLKYVHNTSAKFVKHPLKTMSGVDYINFIFYNAKNCLKRLSSKGRNSVKIISSSIKSPYAYYHYVHNKYARFQKDPPKTLGGDDYTNLIHCNAKIA